MSASRDHRRQAFGVVGVMALDRDRDPLRHVPAPGQHAADQGVVDAELVAFFADPLLGRVGRRRRSRPRSPGWRFDDHEPADVVEKRGDGELVAIGPADRAADLLGGVLGREGVDAEVLRPQLAAAVGLEEVEDGRGAGDRQDAGGLEDVDRLGNACATPPAAAAAVGGAQDGDRQGDVGLDRLDQLADARRSRRSPPASPAPATRPGPGSARPPRRRRRGGRPGAGFAGVLARGRRRP